MKQIACFLLISCFVVCGCTQEDNIIQDKRLKVSIYDTNIFLSSKFDSLINSFIKQNNLKETKGDIFIDKSSVQKTTITIMDGTHELLQDEQNGYYRKPMFYVKKDGCIFNVYSGAEDLLQIDSTHSFPQSKTMSQTRWLLEYYDDKFHFITDKGMPFVPKPTKSKSKINLEE